MERDHPDDLWLSEPHARELMVDLWYPARRLGNRRFAPWMPAAELAYFVPELKAFLDSSPDTPPGQEPINLDVDLDPVDFPRTQAREAAPADPSVRPRPVVLFSPGYAADRQMGTALVEDLASHGYMVVAIGHTYDAAETAFPDGRVELHRSDLDTKPHLSVLQRRIDAQIVLDKLTALANGDNPDAAHRLLPAGLRRQLDMTHVGMFGHSLGGAATAQTIANDRRVGAGINLDGSFFPEDIDPITAPADEVDAALARLAARIDRPLMIMASGGYGPDDLGAFTSIVWYGLAAWRRFVSLVGSTHGSYTDHEWMLDQLAAAGIIPWATPWIGDGEPERIIAVQRTYIRAFLDLSLRGRNSHLLDGPSPDYPEARFF